MGVAQVLTAERWSPAMTRFSAAAKWARNRRVARLPPARLQGINNSIIFGDKYRGLAGVVQKTGDTR